MLLLLFVSIVCCSHDTVYNADRNFRLLPLCLLQSCAHKLIQPSSFCRCARCLAPLEQMFRRGSQEVDTTAHDQWLEQLSEDTKQYVRAVFKTLVATVPKAIIHAQVCSVCCPSWWRIHVYAHGCAHENIVLTACCDSCSAHPAQASRVRVRVS